MANHDHETLRTIFRGSGLGAQALVDDNRGEEHIFKTFDEAVAFAAGLALSTGVRIELDVLVSSRDGAEWWGGSDAADDYDEDPDASVFDRMIIQVTSQGRVP